MRRDELYQASNHIVNLIKKLQIRRFVNSALQRNKGTESRTEQYQHQLPGALGAFLAQSSTFGPSEKSVLVALGLEPLLDPSTWQKLLSDGADNPGSIEFRYSMHRSLSYTEDYFPAIVALLRNEAIILEEEVRKNNTTNNKLLRVIMIEPEAHFSDIGRIAKMFSSIGMLYEAAAIRHGEGDAKLAVIGCDSGSDKAFDFLGLAKLVECVKDILLGMYDRIKKNRTHQISMGLEVIAQSLPILDTIGELEKKKNISAEQAQILRNKVIGGVVGFYESGSMIEEIALQPIDMGPRQLLVPEQKLLTSGDVATPRKVKEKTEPAMASLENGRKHRSKKISAGRKKPSKSN